MFNDEHYSSIDADYKGCVKVIALTATQLGALDAELEILRDKLLKVVLAPGTSDDYRRCKIRSLIALGKLLEQSNNGLWARATKVEEVRDVL